MCMQISAISTPNFSGRRDNVDALIGLDDNSIRQIAFAETSAKFDRKKSNRITNALFYAAPVAAGLNAAVLTKGKSKIFSKEVTGMASRAASGLKVAALWTAGLAAIDTLGFAKRKLVENSPKARQFDNEHPFISLMGTLAAGVGALFLLNKGVAKLASKEAPKFMQKGTEKVAKFINKNKMMVGAKNGLKNIAEKTPSALKEFGKSLLSWSPTMLLFGGLFHSMSAANAQNRDFAKNYTILKNKQSDLAQARVRELSMENDFLKTSPENKEDLELLHDPMAGIAEEVANAEENA